MATKKRRGVAKAPRRVKWTLGRKLAMWTADNRLEGKMPDSLTQVAIEMGTAQSMVSRWAHGQRPKADEAAAIARMMGVSIEYLLDDEQPYPPPAGARSWNVLDGVFDDDERADIIRWLSDPGGRKLALTLARESG